MSRRCDKRERGVTLVELLVTLTVLVIVLTVGVSQLALVVAQNRRSSEVNTFIGHLNFARSEAVFRATKVTLCPVASSAPATCSGSDWSAGYAVVADEGESNAEALRYHNPTGALVIDSTEDLFVFKDDGSASGYQGNVTFCDAGGTADPVRVVLGASGRVRLQDWGSISCD